MVKIDVYFKDAKNMEELDDDSIDLIVTSPPYYDMRGDCEYDSYEHYLAEMKEIVKECYRVLKSGRVACIVVSNYPCKGVFYPVAFDWYELMKSCRFKMVEDIVWEKYSGLPYRRVGNLIQNPYPFYYKPNKRHEYILVFSKGKIIEGIMDEKSKVSSVIVNKCISDVWKIRAVSQHERVKDSSGKYHSSEFPLEVPYRLISLYSYVGDTVLDPFLGSGTTLLAAKMLGRNGVGYEKYRVSPSGVNYAEIIEKKLSMNVVSLDKFFDKIYTTRW